MLLSRFNPLTYRVFSGTLKGSGVSKCTYATKSENKPVPKAKAGVTGRKRKKAIEERYRDFSSKLEKFKYTFLCVSSMILHLIPVADLSTRSPNHSHNVEDPVSMKALRALTRVINNPGTNKNPMPALKNVELDVAVRVPTEDEFRELIPLANPPEPSTFITFSKKSKRKPGTTAADPSSDFERDIQMFSSPTSAKTLHETVSADPARLKWPIFVSWSKMRMSMGNPNHLQPGVYRVVGEDERSMANLLRPAKQVVKKAWEKELKKNAESLKAQGFKLTKSGKLTKKQNRSVGAGQVVMPEDANDVDEEDETDELEVMDETEEIPEEDWDDDEADKDDWTRPSSSRGARR